MESIPVAHIANPRPGVRSTLLLAGSDGVLRAAEGYFEWLAPRPMPVIVEGLASLTANRRLPL